MRVVLVRPGLTSAASATCSPRLEEPQKAGMGRRECSGEQGFAAQQTAQPQLCHLHGALGTSSHFSEPYFPHLGNRTKNRNDKKAAGRCGPFLP